MEYPNHGGRWALKFLWFQARECLKFREAAYDSRPFQPAVRPTTKGIETEAQLDDVRCSGCDFVPGFFFARTMYGRGQPCAAEGKTRFASFR